MTLASTTTKTIYAGNGSTAAFAVPFMFAQSADIEVTITDVDGNDDVKTISTDYSLTGAGEQTGGVCTMVTPPATGEKLTIRRDPSIVQEVDYVENDAFPASTHEAALDKLTMICQALSERLDRTITFRVSSTVSGVEFPDPVGGRALAWDETGDNFENGPTADEIANAQGYAESAATDSAAVGSAKTAAEAARDQTLAVADHLVLDNLAVLLQAVYGDEAQPHTGTDLSSLTVTRNHIEWTLTEASSFSDVALPDNWTGTLVFHVYPATFPLALATSYKTDGGLDDPDPAAGEIRIVVEQYNGRKSIVSLQNMEA